MKTKTIFIISLLFIGAFQLATAQRPLGVSLKKQQLTTTGTPNNVGFYICRVIDARPIRTHIGVVQRGLGNVKTQAFFEEGLETQLQNLFNRSLPAKDGYVPVIAKVTRLTISEHTTFTSEKATAAVAIDFITQRQDSLFLLFQASSLVQNGGLDVTALHDDNLALALSECVDQFRESDWKVAMNNAPLITPEQLTSTVAYKLETADTPIFQTLTPVRGMYQTFLEFRKNAPSLTQVFVTESEPHRGKNWEGINKITPYYELPNQKREKVEDVWGFSDGKQSYIYYQKEYFPLRRQGEGFLFDAYAAPDAGTVGAASLMGGLVGGAIAAAATSNRKQTYFLDVVTGQVIEWNSTAGQMHKAGNTAQIASYGSANITIYYRASKKAEDKAAQIIFRNASDTTTIELVPNSFVKIKWEDLTSEIQVCLKGANNPCYVFVPDVTQNNYLEYIPSVGKDAIVIRPVKDNEAEFYLKQIRYAQEHQKKN